MASATSAKDKGLVAPDSAGAGGDPPRNDNPTTGGKPPGGSGFFSIHKPTQGRTVRIATGAGAALLIGLTVHFFLTQVPAWFFSDVATRSRIGPYWTGGVLALGALLALVAWRLINKPVNAEFLIATDSEMKKVNWTSRKELWGSTKVVITFMLMIAAILFVVDLVFHYLFWIMDVLKFKPLGM